MGYTLAQKLIRSHLVSGDMTPGSEVALKIVSKQGKVPAARQGGAAGHKIPRGKKKKKALDICTKSDII